MVTNEVYQHKDNHKNKNKHRTCKIHIFIAYNIKSIKISNIKIDNIEKCNKYITHSKQVNIT